MTFQFSFPYEKDTRDDILAQRNRTCRGLISHWGEAGKLVQKNCGAKILAPNSYLLQVVPTYI